MAVGGCDPTDMARRYPNAIENWRARREAPIAGLPCGSTILPVMTPVCGSCNRMSRCSRPGAASRARRGHNDAPRTDVTNPVFTAPTVYRPAARLRTGNVPGCRWLSRLGYQPRRAYRSQMHRRWVRLTTGHHRPRNRRRARLAIGRLLMVRGSFHGRYRQERSRPPAQPGETTSTSSTSTCCFPTNAARTPAYQGSVRSR